MENIVKEIIQNHQRKIKPVVSRYFQNKKIIDAGCGNGINSFFFNKEYNSDVTLTDHEDIREREALQFPFYKSSLQSLPFGDKTFDIAFLQYVLHHLSPDISATAVINELKRIAIIIILVEEISTEKTDPEKARTFDLKMNHILLPSANMPIFSYFTDESIKQLFMTADLKILEEQIIDEGSGEDGYLQRKIYVLQTK